jgi:hypothetical protein
VAVWAACSTGCAAAEVRQRQRGGLAFVFQACGHAQHARHAQAHVARIVQLRPLRHAGGKLVGRHILRGHVARFAPVPGHGHGIGQVLAQLGRVIARAHRARQHLHGLVGLPGKRERQAIVGHRICWRWAPSVSSATSGWPSAISVRARLSATLPSSWPSSIASS